MIGTKLTHYEMTGRLGAGGMGEVYKATDTRLGRVVAVKILHSEFSGQEEFQQRFEREAQTIASLNHPHICTLYDVGKQDGMNFLVMEFLEGETLAARLARGALPLDEALDVAAQISDALDKAHTLGVTHRDLKPANIMLTESGAKLMDFGLAKRHSSVDVGSAPTVATAARDLTQQGSVIGTVPYMAPEQIEGEEADPRTDIFAFGVVLYEMITGTRAFTGKTQASLMASILHHQPAPLSTLQALTPPALQRVVEICMAKNPRDRWQTAHDLTLQLKWIAEGGSQAGLPAPVVQRRKRREVVVWAIAAAGLLAAAALAAGYLWKTPADVRVMRFPIFPNEGTAFGPEDAGIRPFPAISPDGKRIAFLAQKPNEPVYLWVRRLDALEAEPLPGTEDALLPFWSPDSRSIAFTAGGKLKRIDASGGPVQVLADIPLGRSAEGSWNRNGTIVFSHGMGNPESNSGILRVSDTGGMPAVIIPTNRERKEGALQAPYFLPDGKHFVYLALEPNVLYAGSLDSTELPKRLVQADSHAVYSNGFLLFVRQGNLMTLKFDPNTLAVSGDPLPVAEKVRTNLGNGRSAFSTSDNGTLVYRTGSNLFNNEEGLRLMWLDREGKQGAAINQTGDNRYPYLSPDERQVVVKRSATPAGNAGGDLWTIDLVRGTNTRLTFGNGDPFPGGWSPDGSRILYRANPDGKYALYAKPATGVGAEELLLKFDRDINGVFDWSRDNRFVVFTVADSKTGTDIWTLPLFGDRKPQAFVDTTFDQRNPRFSPDSRWIAYDSNESGVSQVYIQPFPPTGQRVQVSVEGGSQPIWRGDGKELFFVQGNRMLATDIKTTASTIEAGSPHRLFLRSPSPEATVSRDGQRFLIPVPPSSVSEFATDNQPLVVVTNWTSALKQ